VAFLGLAAGTTRAQTPGYHLPGFALPGTSSSINALTPDGRVAAGHSQGGTVGQPGFIWSESAGRYDFGLEAPVSRFSSPAAISDDGSTVVGTNGFTDAYVWHGPGTYQPLGFLPPSTTQPPHDRSQGRGVSGDGSIVVGESHKTQSLYGQAFRWTQSGGMQGIGFTFPDHVYSEANAISRDGNVIVGMSQSALGRTDAFAWTQASGMRALQLAPGATSAMASGTNLNGSMVVGYSYNTIGLRTAALWTNDTIQLLATPAGWRSWAMDLNDDATVVIGIMDTQTTSTPAIWTPAGGWQTPGVYFAAQGFPLPTGWNVTSVNAISADGRMFAGTFNFGSGLSEAFVLTVPAPCATAIVALLGVPCLRRPRRV
jgi:probable HAF family extracellular repeat protein